jgi:DNA-directed RNA polymerase specialized sigma24 family protein
MAPPITPAVGTDGRTRTTPEAVALLHQAQAGDIESFATLYCTYRGLIGRYVYVRTRDRDAADDLAQDTFTDALIGLPGADDDVVGWLLRLAARCCTRHVWGVRRQRRAAHELHEQPLPRAGARPDTLPITLVAALIAGAQLTCGQRQAVVLCLAGYPRDAAAIEMDRTREAVRGLERHAIGHLRALVAVDGAQ